MLISIVITINVVTSAPSHCYYNPIKTKQTKKENNKNQKTAESINVITNTTSHGFGDAVVV